MLRRRKEKKRESNNHFFQRLVKWETMYLKHQKGSEKE